MLPRMIVPRSTRVLGSSAWPAVVVAAWLGSGCAPAAAPDRLSDGIARTREAIAADTTSDPLAREVREVARPVVERSAAALQSGRRELALFELARAMPLVDALGWMAAHRAAAASMDALEAEWKRMDAALAPAPAANTAPPRVRAALAGALAEAALPQARIYYDASLDYARSTAPDAGLFYMGQASAQQAFAAFAAGLRERSQGATPAFRGIAGDLDDLEGEMLAAYRPPRSIEQHPRFIAAASALKEARELDALGLRRGALLRYLQSALRVQPLLDHPPRFDAHETPARLDSFATRLDRDRMDHGIGRLFLELARADLEDTTAEATHEVAAGVANAVLPRYLAALRPAAPRPAPPEPRVTVTLVRWPYT